MHDEHLIEKQAVISDEKQTPECNEKQTALHHEKQAIISDEKQNSGYIKATIRVLLQPEEVQIVILRPKTAHQLLEALNLRKETALVIRDGKLLTHDRRIYANESLIVRKVVSSG